MSISVNVRRPGFAFVPPFLAAGIAVALNAWQSLLSPLLVALVIGGIVANTRLAEHRIMVGQAKMTKLLLRLGVVLLGLSLPLGRLTDVGFAGIAVILGTIAVTYTVTTVLGDRIGVSRALTTLIATGFSICGASAIAAVDDAVEAEEREVATAVAMVTVFGSAMILIVPGLSHVFGLSTLDSAMWAGASIHEVAQVAAAASLVGGGAVALAMTIKLGRVAMLAPVYMVATRRAVSDHAAGQRPPLLPWFVIGFAVMVAVRTSGVVDGWALSVGNHATTVLLAAAMFGLGLGIRARELWPVPTRVLVLAACSTLTAAVTSLTLVLLTGHL